MQHPHIENLLAHGKKYELRKRKLGESFKNTEVYLNESKQETTIAAHPEFPRASGKKPGHLRGTVTLTGHTKEIKSVAECTEAFAFDCGVSKAALVKAFKGGYKYAWETEPGKARVFANSTAALPRRKQDVAGKQKKMAQVWTTMQRPPPLTALRAPPR